MVLPAIQGKVLPPWPWFVRPSASHAPQAHLYWSGHYCSQGSPSARSDPRLGCRPVHHQHAIAAAGRDLHEIGHGVRSRCRASTVLSDCPAPRCGTTARPEPPDSPGGTRHGCHNLMSKIIRRRQGLVGHHCSCMCDGYLQQKGRSVADSSSTPRLPSEAKTSMPSIDVIDEMRTRRRT